MDRQPNTAAPDAAQAERPWIWTDEELAIIDSWVERKVPVGEIMATFPHRSVKAVQARLVKRRKLAGKSFWAQEASDGEYEGWKRRTRRSSARLAEALRRAGYVGEAVSGSVRA